jgi:hypothetical protein
MTINANNLVTDPSPVNLLAPGSSDHPYDLTIADSDPDATVSAMFNLMLPGTFVAGSASAAYGGLKGNGIKPSAAGDQLTWMTASVSPAELSAIMNGIVYSAPMLPVGTAFELDALVTDSDNVTQSYSEPIMLGRPITISAPTVSPGNIVAGSSSHPLSNLVVTDSNAKPGAAVTETANINVGSSSGDVPNGSPGQTFSISASSAGALTSALHNFVYTAANPQQDPFTSFTVEVTDDLGVSSDAYVAELKNATEPLPLASSDNFVISDTTTGAAAAGNAGQTYSGPVTYLTSEYLSPTQDSVNINSHVPNAFIVTGEGNDAVDVSGANGQNVISAGAGNNFLTGGSGADTFFIDDRTAGQAIWDTINGSHAGDAVTVWGMTPQNILQWLDNQGAAGYTGLTFLTPEPGGGPYAALTLPGYSQADLASGRLTTAFGSSGGSPYLYILAH